MKELHMKNGSIARIIILLTIGMMAFLIVPSFTEARIVSMSASDDQHSAAINDDGTVWVWGARTIKDTTGLAPTVHPELSGIKAVSGEYALKDDGTVWEMGYQDIYDEKGDYTYTYTYDLKAHKLDGFENITAIACRGDNLIALKDDGTVWMIGNNCYGQLGMDAGYGDPNSNFIRPIQIKGLTGVKAVSMGYMHAVALKNDGTVWAWGMNNQGQLGDGTYDYRNAPEGKTIPVMAKGLTNVTAIAAGEEFTMALRDDGTV